MSHLPDMQEWLKATQKAMDEVSVNTMGLDHLTVNKTHPDIPSKLCGSCISLAVDGDPIIIGILADKRGCQSLAKSMLGLSPEEADLPDSDVADAVGEIANIIAGGVKRLMTNSIPSIQLGLPTFINGQIEYGKSQEALVSEVMAGSTLAHLMVLKRRSQ